MGVIPLAIKHFLRRNQNGCLQVVQRGRRRKPNNTVH